MRAAAQDQANDPNAWTAKGTITTVYPPDGFEVKGKRVSIVATTKFEPLGGSPRPDTWTPLHLTSTSGQA